MNSHTHREAVLALADGTIFRGTAIGADGSSVGEVVFNTALTGYQEILTDPEITEWVFWVLGRPPFNPFILALSALSSYFTRSRFRLCLIGIKHIFVIRSGASGFKSLTYLNKCFASLPASSSVSSSNDSSQSQ